MTRFRCLKQLGLLLILLSARLEVPGAQEDGRHLAPDDRFVRVINLVEPFLTKRWKSGVDWLRKDAVVISDLRTGECSNYLPFKEADLTEDWRLRPTILTEKTFSVAFPPEIRKSIFITVFCFGSFHDNGQTIRVLVTADSLTSSDGSRIRIISGVNSFPLKLAFQNEALNEARETAMIRDLAAKSFRLRMSWADKAQRQREAIFEWDLTAGSSYTIAVANSGEGDRNPFARLYEDSSMAKRSVSAFLAAKSAPWKHPK